MKSVVNFSDLKISILTDKIVKLLEIYPVRNELCVHCHYVILNCRTPTFTSEEGKLYRTIVLHERAYIRQYVFSLFCHGILFLYCTVQLFCLVS